LAPDETVQDYYALAARYLDAARLARDEGLMEPALFNAIHALELAVKAALATVAEADRKTRNVGGEFGRHFLKRVGRDACRRVSRILAKYTLPRYPSQRPFDEDEASEDIEFIGDFILNTVRELIEG
jgi:HEPN domain-containing protein